MKSKFMRLALALAFILTSAAGLLAQKYDLNTMPPLDPKVRTGVLDNGMHYYISSNKLPEKRGEFYIAHNVGAILEDDDQNGLAHFTEHMAFNGTENFPKKGILDYLATIGVKFGTNVNAGTGVEQTVYNLSNVPLTREGIIDSALLILHDWSNYISFEPVEIDLERGVIREEWRMYGTADERMQNKLAPVIYKGSKYAKRDVIGDTAVINHFKYQTIKNFYKKWYRPDLQAIIVVGDFDVNVIESKIRKLFSSIPKSQNPAPKGEFPLPDNITPLIGTATDKEATETSVDVSFKHDAIKDNNKNLGYMRLQLIRNLINTMFSERMNEISRKENPPFISAYSYYGNYVRAKDAFSGTAQAANNESVKALKALLTEMQRMNKYGFTTTEFERAKANMLRNYESRYMERDKRKNRELVYANVMNFLINNPNPGIEYEYQFANEMVPNITLDEVNAEAKKYVTDNNMIVTVTGPDKPGVTLPTVQNIQNVLANYKTQKIDPYVDLTANKKLLEKEPVPGSIKKSATNNDPGFYEAVLSNGMRVIIKSTDFKEDELLIRGYSPGGTSLLKTEELHTADILSDAVNQMGVSDFSRTDLTKMLAGKKVNVSLNLSSDRDEISARTSPKDLETTLQLIYLYFTNPRWNEADFKTWMSKMKAYYINAESEPRKAFSDSIQVMINNHNKRTVPMTYKFLDEITLTKLQSIYKDRYSDPGNFIFQFIGKINPDSVKPLLEKYLASIPTVSRNEVYKDNGVRPPQGKVKNDFLHETKTPRTSVFVNFNGSCEYNAENKLLGDALRHVLELRYIESIREEEGGAYSIRVMFNVSKVPEPNFRMNVMFETDPLKADKLVGIVEREAAKMMGEGPTDAELQKATEYFLKQRQEDLKENNWWNNTLIDFSFYGLNYLTGYENNVRALKVADIKDFAKKVLGQDNRIEIIMRPK
ncbi:MAG: insulinase family protein [Bacteroidetes bacterium]|nr:insulinase family protein [Bacteroidota bacterium]